MRRWPTTSRLMISMIISCFAQGKENLLYSEFVSRNKGGILLGFPSAVEKSFRLKPCSHSTLIMINWSIIQATILHSILFNYGSVHTCENSNTIGKITSQCETKWRRIAWLPSHDYHHHGWGEKRTKENFPRIEEDDSKSSLHEASWSSSAHTTTRSPLILFNYALQLLQTTPVIKLEIVWRIIQL